MPSTCVYHETTIKLKIIHVKILVVSFDLRNFVVDDYNIDEHLEHS